MYFLHNSHIYKNELYIFKVYIEIYSYLGKGAVRVPDGPFRYLLYILVCVQEKSDRPRNIRIYFCILICVFNNNNTAVETRHIKSLYPIYAIKFKVKQDNFFLFGMISSIRHWNLLNTNFSFIIMTNNRFEHCPPHASNLFCLIFDKFVYIFHKSFWNIVQKLNTYI